MKYKQVSTITRLYQITIGKHWYRNYDGYDILPYNYGYCYMHNHSDFDQEDYREYFWFFYKRRSKRRKGMVKFYSHGNGKRRRTISRERIDDLPF